MKSTLISSCLVATLLLTPIAGAVAGNGGKLPYRVTITNNNAFPAYTLLVNLDASNPITSDKACLTADGPGCSINPKSSLHLTLYAPVKGYYNLNKKGFELCMDTSTNKTAEEGGACIIFEPCNQNVNFCMASIWDSGSGVNITGYKQGGVLNSGASFTVSK